LSKQNRFNVSV